MPPVYLNHLLIFVDSVTYRAIAESDFLMQELAPAEERTTIDEENNASWTGCYYYGVRTYFEFMDPDATTWKPVDGIAFGVDEPEAAAVIRDRLARILQTDVRRYPRTRRYEGRDISWFDMIEHDRPDDAQMISWLMAYDPEFLRRWEPHLPPALGGVRREDILQRYRSRVENGDSRNWYFKDITNVSVVLPENDGARLRKELAAFGYIVSGDGNTYTAAGPDISITVNPGDLSHTGIRTFTVSLNHEKKGNREYSFGPQCSLTFGDDLTATWTLQ